MKVVVVKPPSFIRPLLRALIGGRRHRSRRPRHERGRY